MKSKLLIICLLFFTQALMAQVRFSVSINPPRTIIENYNRDFPHGERPQWALINREWRAHFVDRGPDQLGDMMAYYDRDGHRIDYHIPYDRDDVPPVVIDRHHEVFHDGRVIGYNRIVGSDDHSIYEVRYSHRGRQERAYYDEEGHDRQFDDHHDRQFDDHHDRH